MSESEVTETVETIDTTEETPEVVEKSSPEQLPDDHPLVRALASQKALNKELKAKAAKLDEIENAQKLSCKRQSNEPRQPRSEPVRRKSPLLA